MTDLFYTSNSTAMAEAIARFGTVGQFTNSVTITHPMDYKCGTCRKRYRRVDTSWSCCVAHSPGTCCHAFEQRITKKGYPKERHA